MSASELDAAGERRWRMEGRRGERRRFLKEAGALPIGLLAAQSATEAKETKDTKEEKPLLPQVRLGRHSISRLVCGTNPFHGGSHLSVFVDRAMKEYYTPEQILKTLRRCQEAGINCYQAGLSGAELYRRFIDEGGRMHFIAIAARDASAIETLAKAGCIGVAHHGEVTDRLFKSGQLDQAHDYLKRIRDAGLLVGVSTHMPAVVEAIESKGWDVDYYMTCVYERHRSAEDLEQLLGQAPIPVGECYLPLDPPRMFKVINQTKKTCLAFKILAAGRLSKRRAWVEDAFRQTLQSIKPTDGVIVGMYDRYDDQPAMNAELVRRFGARKESV